MEIIPARGAFAFFIPIAVPFVFFVTELRYFSTLQSCLFIATTLIMGIRIQGCSKCTCRVRDLSEKLKKWFWLVLLTCLILYIVQHPHFNKILTLCSSPVQLKPKRLIGSSYSSPSSLYLSNAPSSNPNCLHKTLASLSLNPSSHIPPQTLLIFTSTTPPSDLPRSRMASISEEISRLYLAQPLIEFVFGFVSFCL